MMLLALLCILPVALGGAAMFARTGHLRWYLLVGGAAANLGITLALLTGVLARRGHPLFGIDELGLIVLLASSVVFLAVSLQIGSQRAGEQPQALFTACLLWFLAAMNLVVLARHLALLWVAIEATTLASAPLIYHHRSRRSLEAVWKYLLLCSVGIAIALIGTLLLSFAVAAAARGTDPLYLERLLRIAPQADGTLLRAAFLFVLVGYGTKMGLAPMHAWLPDAHSEAPSPVSALLSGALLNCAFLGVLRVFQVCAAAGIRDFAARWLIVFGVLSLFVSAALLIQQRDYKRMLAFSSIEHMGLLAIGAAAGGLATVGALLHVLTHGFTKGSLFLTAGNILQHYGTKQVNKVRALVDRAPRDAFFWMCGLIAISGIPPFGTFLSEFLIIRGLFDRGWGLVAAAVLVLLTLVFAAMSSIMLRMTFGPARGGTRLSSPLLQWAATGGLLAVVLLLGLQPPRALMELLNSASTLLASGQP
ncbi:MAG TPA: proton-conducting transporter membrane subunit [Longimicrobiales bacterium]|nr:proton-conducting transporter membrane subunit [Longimicrobiales bacterium]